MDQLQKYNNETVKLDMEELIRLMRASKPNDRSEADRRYAVTITEMEKVYAYFMQYVMNGENE